MKFLLVLLAAAIIAAPAEGQIDYRNLDQGRPGAVEDAYALEHYGFDLSGQYRRVGTPAGGVNLVIPEVMFGFARAAQVGLRLPYAVPSGSIANAGLAGAEFSVLLNVSTERISLPGLAVRLDASVPAGAAAGRGTGVSVTGLATHSFGAQRVHLNASLALVSPDAVGAAGPIPRWWVGVALDHTVLRKSLLLVAEGSAGSEAHGAPVRYTAGVGARQQLAPTLVLNAGLELEFARRNRAESVVTFGLSHSFALAFLMPGGGR